MDSPLRNPRSSPPSVDRLMLETDTPYLTPRTLHPKRRRRRDEPAFLPHVLQTVADSLGQAPEAIADTTTRTARQFFRLPEQQTS